MEFSTQVVVFGSALIPIQLGAPLYFQGPFPYLWFAGSSLVVNECSFPVVAGGSKLVIGHMLLLIYGWGSSLVVVRGTSYYMLHGASLEFHCREFIFNCDMWTCSALVVMFNEVNVYLWWSSPLKLCLALLLFQSDRKLFSISGGLFPSCGLQVLL